MPEKATLEDLGAAARDWAKATEAKNRWMQEHVASWWPEPGEPRPPEPELEREPMLYQTSRDGVYRTGDRGEYVLVAGKARLSSNVQAEMANRLTNLPNFQAWSTLVEGNRLAEYELETEPPKGDPDPGVAAHIRKRSRAMARARSEIEKMIRERMARGVPPITFYD